MQPQFRHSQGAARDHQPGVGAGGGGGDAGPGQGGRAGCSRSFKQAQVKTVLETVYAVAAAMYISTEQTKHTMTGIHLPVRPRKLLLGPLGRRVIASATSMMRLPASSPPLVTRKHCNVTCSVAQLPWLVRACSLPALPILDAHILLIPCTILASRGQHAQLGMLAMVNGPELSTHRPTPQIAWGIWRCPLLVGAMLLQPAGCAGCCPAGAPNKQGLESCGSSARCIFQGRCIIHYTLYIIYDEVYTARFNLRKPCMVSHMHASKAGVRS